MSDCPYVVYHHTVGLPSHLDYIDEELTEILVEEWEAQEGKMTVEQAVDKVNSWSELGDETKRELYCCICK